jgi:hypothetical protein
LILAGAFVVFPVSDASAAVSSNAATDTTANVQWEQRRGRGWDNDRRGRDRVYIQTRTVRRGRYVYRETYRVRVHNGRVSTKLISRTRIYYRA